MFAMIEPLTRMIPQPLNPGLSAVLGGSGASGGGDQHVADAAQRIIPLVLSAVQGSAGQRMEEKFTSAAQAVSMTVEAGEKLNTIAQRAQSAVQAAALDVGINVALAVQSLVTTFSSPPPIGPVTPITLASAAVTVAEAILDAERRLSQLGAELEALAVEAREVPLPQPVRFHVDQLEKLARKEIPGAEQLGRRLDELAAGRSAGVNVMNPAGAGHAEGVASFGGGAGNGVGIAEDRVPAAGAETATEGEVAGAPSPAAAKAVAAAKTALGTPYQWGGNTPGVGLDCSGLTKWAYGEAGVELPRLADQQAIGPQIPRDQVAPGDLAVWDGHVAMVVEDGQMIEAGNPVSINPIRTENAGMGFHGFYRPTAA